MKSKSNACNAMVHNPIYEGDGPVYESVQVRVEETCLPADTLQVTDTTNHQYNSINTPATSALQDNSSLNTVRYVKQPVQLQRNSFINTHTSAADNHDTEGTPRSTSTTLQAARVMALKKNGEVRNKLHLTLSLGGNESGHATGESLSPSVCEVVSSGVDGTYMVMSPVSSLCHSLNAGRGEVIPEDTSM